jgi:sterol desaturase/sphingolipid hydroxylase (fatty acid hydroxylase superfamily)
MNDLIEGFRQTAAAVPLYLAWLLILAVAERVFPATEHKSIRGWAFNLATTVLYLVASALAAGLSALLGEVIRAWLGGPLIDLRIRNVNTVLGTAVSTLLFLFVYDFFYYWWHRSQHRYPSLWAIHKLHHLDEGINVSTDLRHHWLEDLGRIPTIVVPMTILFNLSVGDDAVVGFLFASWTFFIHANLRLQLGRLSWLFDGPQVHRIHHSRLPQHFDRNFAAFFPIWDVLFRTYSHPRRDEFPPTGVADEPAVSRVLDGALLPFRTWYKALRTPSANSNVVSP